MESRIRKHQLFEIYQDGRRIFTKSILPGKVHFEERIFREHDEEYREFDPLHSKLAATIVKGCPNIGLRKGNVVLYLGASHGYTCSFVSDIVGKEGLIFALDHAPRVLRDLVFLAEDRENIVPIIADANQPATYLDKVSAVDVVYQDVAQRNQAEIFLKNCQLFLKKGGYGLLSIKARSIDVKQKPAILFKEARAMLEKELTIVDFRPLDPLEKDHCMIIVKK